MLSACLRSAGADVTTYTAANDSSPPTPEVSLDQTLVRRAKELHEALSNEEAPQIVPRDQAIVNLECLNQPAGLSAVRPNSPPATPWMLSRPTTAGTNTDSSAHGGGFHRVKSQLIPNPHGLEWTHSRRALEVLLRNERSSLQRVTCEAEDQAAHQQRLAERLGRLSLDMVMVAADGNCQFRAVSLELFQTQEHHQGIRRKAVTYMMNNRRVYECFLGGDFEVYCARMVQLGTWGDELTLRAIADAYGIIIHVITSDMENWYLTYEPAKLLLSREIFVTYIAPTHYNAIRRQHSLKTMALTVTGALRRLSSPSAAAPSSSSSASAPEPSPPAKAAGSMDEQ